MNWARFYFVLLLQLCLSSCAFFKPNFDTLTAEEEIDVPKSSPEEAYNAGVNLLRQGDYNAAKREFNRCVAMASRSSPLRQDCQVALDKVSLPSTLEP